MTKENSRAGAHLPAHFLFELFEKHPVVEHPGQFVHAREFERLLEELGLLDAGGDEMGEGAQKVEILDPEGRYCAVAEPHDADDPVLVLEGDPDIASVLLVLVRMVQKALEQPRIVQKERLAAGRDLARALRCRNRSCRGSMFLEGRTGGGRAGRGRSGPF